MAAIQATTKEQGMKINRCRIYLQATTIADITSADGKAISNVAWGIDKNMENNQRELKHDWPRQPRPGPKSWYAWRAALRRHLSRDGKTQQLRPLRRWTVSAEQSRQTWKWYSDPSTNTKLEKTKDNKLVHNIGTTNNTKPAKTTNNIPRDAIPSNPGTEHNIKRNQTSKNNKPEQQIEAATSLEKYMETLDQWEASLLTKNKKMQPCNDTINRILTEDKINIVSFILFIRILIYTAITDLLSSCC